MTLLTKPLLLTKPPSCFIGCDVGKANIVVFDGRDGRISSIPNQAADLAAFTAKLDATCLVVCEATGGHEALLLSALIHDKIPVHRADARKVKAFIRSFGTLGKTDEIDARALNVYGKERQDILVRWQAPDKNRQELHGLVLARRDLVADSVAYANRIGAPGSAIVKPILEAVRDSIVAQIKAIDIVIQGVIRRHASLKKSVEILTSICGIGATTAAALIGLMPELGTLPRRQATALAGLAPHPQDSATINRYRRTKGGRPEIKRVLFMAAMSAAKHNKDLRVFHERLIADGKKPLVALVAVMRKMIVLCNAMLRPEPATAS